MKPELTIRERLIEIARASLQRTQDGSMEWRPTDDEAAFLYSGSSTSLIIDYFPQDEQFQLRLLNGRGTVIGTLETEWDPDLSDPTPWGKTAAPWNEVLATLHDAAKRSALQIDVLLDSTLRDLNEMPPF